MAAPLSRMEDHPHCNLPCYGTLGRAFLLQWRNPLFRFHNRPVFCTLPTRLAHYCLSLSCELKSVSFSSHRPHSLSQNASKQFHVVNCLLLAKALIGTINRFATQGLVCQDAQNQCSRGLPSRRRERTAQYIRNNT
ncbi:hypothetical protein NXS19_004155 [Fusarium pseudograminearum]|nr:hypothetical protein NXS19_004155 [Fusarium pseudograminearum]